MPTRLTPSAVRVTAPARLHLGFLDLNGGLGRKFGSIGLAVDQPATRLTIAKSDTLSVEGPESARVERLVERFTEATGERANYAINVEEAIPPHAGFGSGTQLAMSIGAGLAALTDDEKTHEQLAAIGERGARSGIGVAAFKSGGFLIDGGRGSQNDTPVVTLRAVFPAQWRVILILDKAVQGVHGFAETEAFATLPPFPETAAGAVCRLVLMKLLPGLIEADISAFGSALTGIQDIVGAHFAAAQGGSPWTSPAVERAAKRLGALGAVGIGQTSWGPTGFAFVENEKKALSIQSTLVRETGDLEVIVAKGRNNGATIEKLNPTLKT